MGLLRVRFQHYPGESLSWAVERLADGLFYDPQGRSWQSGPPGTLVALAPVAGSGPWSGVYRGQIDASSFPDGEYGVYIFNAGSGQLVGGPISVLMHGGDDSPYFAAPAALPRSWTLTPNP